MDIPKPFYENGKPRFKGIYKNNLMHGCWEFYRKNGTLMRSGSFKEGKQVGTWVTYDSNGKEYKKTEFGN